VDAARTLTIGGTNAIGFTSATVGAGGTLSTAGRLQFLGSSTLGAGATVSGTLGLDFAGPPSHAGAQVFNAGAADLTFLNTSFTPDATDTLTGGRLVLEGSTASLQFSTDAVLGTAGNQIVLKGGRLFPQTSLTLPATRNIEVTAQNGSVIALAGRNIVIEGNLSGAGRFLASGSGDGTLRLTGNNSQAGGTDIAGATLEVASDAQLGGPDGVLLIGRENGVNDIPGKLRALGNLDIAATRSTTFRLATVDTNGFDVTFNQPTTGQGLTKQGEGVLRFNTVNTFNSGTNTIDVEGGTIRLGINEALGQPMVRLYDTTLDLNGFAQTIPSLSGTGAVQLGSGGALTFTGSSTVEAVISGTGTVSFGKAGFSASAHRVLGENTFVGPVTITQGERVTMKTTAAFGAAGNPVLLDNGGIEADSQAPGPIVISAAFPLTIGPGGASFGSNGQSLVIESLLAGNVPIGVHGGWTDSEVRFAHPANTFTSNLDIGTNDFGAAVLGIVADGSLGAAANVVTLGYRFFDGESTRTDTGTLRAFADIAFPASRTLRMDGDGEGDGGGVFDTNGFNMTVAGPLTELHAGTPLRKTGAGTLTLNGINTHTGTTTVETGALVVNGSLGGEMLVSAGATLSGTGTTGSVGVSSGGTLAPGSSSGTLRTGNVTLDGGSTFALHFASPTSASQLAATGTVALNGEVELALTLGFTPATASTFVVITNDGTDPIETFGGATFFSIAGNPLSEGETFTTGGADWTISYVGGTGNDVTLTVAPATAPPAELALVSFSFGTPPGGAAGKQVQGSLSGPPGAVVRMQRSSDLIDWTLLATINLNEAGTATFDMTDPLATERAFYRMATP
jgi:autotransporter-associated beta strand protein